MFNPDGLPVWSDRHRLDSDVAAHEHDFFEVALVTQGTGLHIAADGDHALEPGSVVLIPPNQWHAYGECKDLAVFDCFVAPELIDTTLSFLDYELPLIESVHSSLLPLPQRTQLTPYELGLALAELYSMNDLSDARRSRIQVIGHLMIYLDILNRAWSIDRDAPRRSTAPLHPAVAGSMALMKSDLAHTWTLAQLASATATVRSHLVRLFQRELGIPPIAYLNRARAQVAARQLAQTDRPVAEIGAQLGWQDAAYFARRFKAAYGLSPSAYRKRAHTGEIRRHSPAGAEPPSDRLPLSPAAPHLPSSGPRFDS